MAGQPHPEVERRIGYANVWPTYKPFPLTLLKS